MSDPSLAGAWPTDPGAAATPPGPPPAGAPPRRRRPKPLSVVAGLVAVLIAQLFGIVTALQFARTTAPVGPLDVTLSAQLARRGETSLELPPLGRVSAHTHRLPVRVEVLPTQLRLRSIQELLKKLDDKDAALREARRDVANGVQAYAWRVGVYALLAGALGSLIVGRRRVYQVALSGALCVALVAGLGAGVAGTYDPHAFDAPRYSGVLSEAPVAVEMVRKGFSDLSRVRTQLKNTVTNLGKTYGELAGASDRPGEASLRILHVSDLHNNPAGMDLTSSLAAGYRVAGIVCTGDVTDYGSPVENRLLAAWKAIPMPKLFVSGNHDSRATMRALAAVPGATLLKDGEVITWLGLRVVGWNDPASARPSTGDAEVSPHEVGALRDRMSVGLGGIKPPPDLVLVHNYHAAEGCAGLAPVLLYGHDHSARIAERGGSWLIDAGTTGAAGIRFVTGLHRPSFSAAVLYLAPPPAVRLQAADLMQLQEPAGAFTVQRFTPAMPGGG